MVYRFISSVIILLLFNTLTISQSMLSTKSKKAIELYTEADNYRVRGQYSQALQLLKQAIEKDNEFVEAYYRIGIIYMSQKNYTLAATNFEKGLSLTNDIKKQKVL